METVFFGTEGRTNSSAGHLRNIAKEYYKQLEQKLQDLCFVDTEIELIGSGIRNKATVGVTEIDSIPSMIQEIGECKALCAYLNEAIKAKEINRRELERYELPEYTEHKSNCPRLEEEITSEEVIASWDIKKRQRYFYLGAACSAYGDAIHENGTLANARIDLTKKVNKPTEVATNGRDTIFRYYSASVNPKDVESLYFHLQKEHRKLNAELNGLDNEVKIAIEDDRRKKLNAYEEAYRIWADKSTELATKSTLERNRLLEENKNLKIVIPNSLKPIIDKIEKL